MNELLFYEYKVYYIYHRFVQYNLCNRVFYRRMYIHVKFCIIEPDSGVVSVPLAVGGLRHVQAPETKPPSSTPSLPPGQNICADCERLIV